MLNDISLQNPTITRMLYLQLGITVGFAVIAGFISGSMEPSPPHWAG